MKSNTGTITAYLDELPPDRREALRTIRALIERAAPNAKGSMRLGLPSWEWNGPLFALAAQEHYLALYVADVELVAARKKSLGNVDVGKSCIRFKSIGDLDLSAVLRLLTDSARRRASA